MQFCTEVNGDWKNKKVKKKRYIHKNYTSAFVCFCSFRIVLASPGVTCFSSHNVIHKTEKGKQYIQIVNVHHI
jgi:hypothetical protein